MGNLNKSAKGHSQDMSAKGYFSHTGADGSSFSQRNQRAGYCTSAGGENIAKGQRSEAQVVEGWLNSPGHCRNIMSGRYREIGYFWEASGNYHTQVFGPGGCGNAPVPDSPEESEESEESEDDR